MKNIGHKLQKQKNKTKRTAGVHDAINRMIRLGGMLPSFEKESGLTEYLDSLNYKFMASTNPKKKK